MLNAEPPFSSRMMAVPKKWVEEIAKKCFASG
jgi:hypothetical protein